MENFQNKTILNLNEPQTIEKQKAAIVEVRSRIGKTYQLEAAKNSTRTIVSTNPFAPPEVLATFTPLSAKDVKDQIQKGTQAFESWQHASTSERQTKMENLAKILERRRYEFNALMMMEVGKPWLEADADTCEGIDFVRYYSMSLNDWTQNPRLVQVSGLRGSLDYIPLGLGAVIAPWNFPFAILLGMTSAALVTGNTVIMKPASDSAWIAYELHRAIMEAGFPPDVCQLAIGGGAEVGTPLVEDARIRFICFTGSREVGVDIYKKGAQVQPGQIWLKRMMLEMGGKDGILVDETADLDKAAAGVVASAYGFSGQKCSACSRLIVVKSVKDVLVSKVVEKTKALKLGNPMDPTTQMGPVVNKQSFEKVGKYIEIGVSEGKMLCGGKPVDGMGYTWQPTVFDGIGEKHRLFQEEIFGPVLAITEAKNFEDGVRLMNATDYGLTGSVYTTDEKRKEFARKRVHVGNLYINRKCTGAMVGQHPFGGFNMSGTDSKAGGPDYLSQFVQPKYTGELTHM